MKRQMEERGNFLENGKVIMKEQQHWKNGLEEEKTNFKYIIKSQQKEVDLTQAVVKAI